MFAFNENKIYGDYMKQKLDEKATVSHPFATERSRVRSPPSPKLLSERSFTKKPGVNFADKTASWSGCGLLRIYPILSKIGTHLLSFLLAIL